MRNLSWSFVGALACGIPVGCADPCIDDGLGQDACPTQNTVGATDGATDSSTDSPPGTATMGTMTQGMSGSQTSGPTDSDTDTGGDLWCVDADMDGFGDPDDCQRSEGPVDGSVPNGDDCDDTNPNTFPGAAPLDDPTACMQDEDEDDWGDDAPPPGVDPGTDCDDSNAAAYPGAAFNETPPDLCRADSDGDGWGDANPGGGGGGGPGPSSGSDCYPTNADLNPDTVQLTALLPYSLPGAIAPGPRTIQTVDPTDASLSPFVTLQGPMGGALNQLVVIAVAMSELGDIVANDRTNRQLYSIDYLTGGACMMAQGTAAPFGMSYDANPATTLAPEDIVCAIEYGPGGGLYGVDFASQLIEFNPAMDQIMNTTPLTGTTITGCGMARDCTQDRLLIANRQSQSILSVDVATGMTTVVRNLQAELATLGIPWDGPTGLEYDPVTRHAFLSVGAFLLDVDLDPVAPAPTVVIGNYGQLVSNLQYLPICN